LPRRWTWISPSAAWLVFDPRRTTRVSSALQLFGSATFWMFWRNGYEALASLDDNGDGALRGQELAGLALWHDRDCNGVSSPSEVRPVREYGIVSLSVRWTTTTHSDLAAIALDGVEFTTGARRPTYDVILRSASVLTN
jgi:hypothetical protein